MTLWIMLVPLIGTGAIMVAHRKRLQTFIISKANCFTKTTQGLWNWQGHGLFEDVLNVPANDMLPAEVTETHTLPNEYWQEPNMLKKDINQLTLSCTMNRVPSIESHQEKDQADRGFPLKVQYKVMSVPEGRMISREEKSRHFACLHSNSNEVGTYVTHHGCEANSVAVWQYSNCLDSLCDTYGRKSDKIRDICVSIIAQTKETIETRPEYIDIVADIYPSYTTQTPNRIVFVITLKRQVDESLLKKHIPYATELRVLGRYSDEAKYVYNSEIAERMSVKDQLKAKQCINMNCENLFKRHRYLSIITANNKRSRGFKTDTHSIDKQLCLVLFVHAKGFIPIDEEQFSSMDDEFDIDVLEGVFTPYVKDCQEYQADVKMGCMISRSDNVVGTLGGFIDHHKHGLVGLTCAHVLLNETEYNHCKDHGENLGLDKWPDEYRDVERRHVFQPNKKHNQGFIGQIVEAVCCPGGDNRSGIDAVLFQVEARFPSSGGSPSVSKDGENKVPACSFETGKICGPLPYLDNTVTKFGAATELTKGYLEFEVPFVCVKTVDSKLIGGPFKIELLHQYQVRAIPGSSCFSSNGDSGALILAEDLDKKKVCIGILEGGEENSQLTIVTPIHEVFERFKIRNFKQFENEENAKRLVEMVSTVKEMNKKIDALSAMQSTVDRIEENQKRIEQFINGNNSQNQQNV